MSDACPKCGRAGGVCPDCSARAYTTSRGLVVRSTLTDQEALAALLRIDVRDDFVTKLVREFKGLPRRFVSESMMAWGHKKALEQIDAEIGSDDYDDQPSEVGVFLGLLEFLSIARPSLARGPKIDLKLEQGLLRLRMSVAGVSEGIVWVDNGVSEQHSFDTYRMPCAGPVKARVLYGRVTQAGQWLPARSGWHCPAWVADALYGLAADPRGYVATYGRATGYCCFCSLPLKDAVAVALGYGETCARNYGLPYGKRHLGSLGQESPP